MEDVLDHKKLAREFARMEDEEFDGGIRADAIQTLLELSNEDEALVLGFTYGLIAAKHIAAKKRMQQEANERMRKASEEGLNKVLERHMEYRKDTQEEEGPEQDGETPEAERNDE